MYHVLIRYRISISYGIELAREYIVTVLILGWVQFEQPSHNKVTMTFTIKGSTYLYSDANGFCTGEKGLWVSNISEEGIKPGCIGVSRPVGCRDSRAWLNLSLGGVILTRVDKWPVCRLRLEYGEFEGVAEVPSSSVSNIHDWTQAGKRLLLYIRILFVDKCSVWTNEHQMLLWPLHHSAVLAASLLRSLMSEVTAIWADEIVVLHEESKKSKVLHQIYPTSKLENCWNTTGIDLEDCWSNAEILLEHC